MTMFSSCKVLLVTLGLTVGLGAGCKKSLFPDDAPYYPGANPGGSESWPSDGYTLTKNSQFTPDSFEKVNAFYQEKLGARPRWMKKSLDTDEVRWTDGNMRSHTTNRNFSVEPEDPTRPGRMVRIVNAGNAVVTEVWVAVPSKKK